MIGQDPKARPLWWAALGLLLVNGLVFASLVLPARGQRMRQENQVLDLQRRVRTAQREGESGEAFLSAVRELEEFAQGYPSRAELVGLIGRLGKLAQSLAVEISTTDYQPSQVKEAELTKVAVSMAVEGTYSKIRRFLYELERLRRHLVIERLSLKDPKGTSELQVHLQVAVYVR